MGLNIKFRFDKKLGRVTEFLVDDGDRTAPEEHHDALARLIANELMPTATIRDAGEMVTADPEPARLPHTQAERRRRGQGDT